MEIIIPSHRIYYSKNDKNNDNIINQVNLGAKTSIPETFSLFSNNCIFLDKKDVNDVYVMSGSSQNPSTSNTLDYHYVTVGDSSSQAPITPDANTLYRIQYNGETYYYRYDENGDYLLKTYVINPNNGNYEIVINDTYTNLSVISYTYYDAVGYDKQSRWNSNVNIDKGYTTPYATEAFDYLVTPEENSVYKIMLYDDVNSKKWYERRLIYSGSKFFGMLSGMSPLYEKDRNRYYLPRSVSPNINDEMVASYWQSNQGDDYGVCIRLRSESFDRDFTLPLSPSFLKANITIKGDTPDVAIQSRFIEYDETDGDTISAIDSDVFVGITYNSNSFESVFRSGAGSPAIANMRGKKAIISLSSFFDAAENSYKYRIDLLADCFRIVDEDGNAYAKGRTPVTEINLEITTVQQTAQEENEANQDNSYYYNNNSDLNVSGNTFNQTLISEITNDYQNGKETATIRVSINDYYDTDGNIAVSINKHYGADGQELDIPMLFKNGDIVIPYVATPNGDRPMSSNPDGTPKEFLVTGVTLISDGAVWQELQLQEVSS